MQENYKAFIDRMIQKYEGGYGWDAGDPGGPTKYGITCYDLAAHMGKRMTSMAAWAPIVRAMPLETAEAIYITKYASKDRFNDLEGGSDCVMIDYGVNSGTLRPIWVAQSITGRPRSNTFSDDLLKAINDMSADRFIDQMCDQRMRFLRALATWPRFRGGWTSRVADLRQYAHRISNDLEPEPVPNIPDHVAVVKTAQRQYNVIYSLSPPLDVDGFEGPKTKEITRRFQTEHNLAVDGVIGPETMHAIAMMSPPVAPALGLLSVFEPEERVVMARGIETYVDLDMEVA